MNLLGSMMHRTALASGAEYLTTFLETWHTITQAHTLKLGQGWKIAGIFPDNFTRWAGDQEEHWGCEIYLCKFINEGEKYATRPGGVTPAPVPGQTMERHRGSQLAAGG